MSHNLDKCAMYACLHACLYACLYACMFVNKGTVLNTCCHMYHDHPEVQAPVGRSRTLLHPINFIRLHVGSMTDGVMTQQSACCVYGMAPPSQQCAKCKSVCCHVCASMCLVLCSWTLQSSRQKLKSTTCTCQTSRWRS